MPFARCPATTAGSPPIVPAVAAVALTLLAVGATAPSPATAADRVKVGLVTTLSGPQAALGTDIRDGFQLAVKLAGNKLGGLPAEVLVNDDQFKPDVGKQLFEKNSSAIASIS